MASSAIDYAWDPTYVIPTEVTGGGFPSWLEDKDWMFFEYVYDDTKNFLTVVQGEYIDNMIIWTATDPEDGATWAYFTYNFATGDSVPAQVDLSGEAVSNGDTIIVFVTFMAEIEFRIFFGPTHSYLRTLPSTVIGASNIRGLINNFQVTSFVLF
jgi:hypothetical protein